MSTFLPIASITALLLAATPALAQRSGTSAEGVGSPGRDASRMRAVQIEKRYVDDLNRLRGDILARQSAEGGTLSPASRTAFQGKLDRINAERRRLARNNDSFSIDSMGRPIRTALD